MYLPEPVMIAVDAAKQSLWGADYGHIGEQDSIINIIEAARRSRLKDGDLMIIVAAGTGWVWGTTSMRGPCGT
jgi:3-oxoacyl-[acyl-carrier-protein] synthase-3